MIITLLSTFAAAQTAAPPASIFGISIDEPLTLSECVSATDPNKYHANSSAYKGRFSYKYPDVNPCFERLNRQGLGDAPINETVHVQFPLKDRLATAADNTIVVQLIDGKVAFIRFNTKGRIFQDEDLVIFTNKYGKPTTVRAVPLQNGFGAQFESLIAVWRINRNVTATYSSFSGGLGGRYGDFSVGTAQGKSALEAPIRAALESTRGL